MLSYTPLFALALSCLYVGIIYLFVRKEKKAVFYSVITFVSILQGVFFVTWSWIIISLKINLTREFPSLEDLILFVDLSYYIVSIPFLLIIMWFGSKIILSQKHFPLLRIVFLVFFILALIGVFILWQPIHDALYYGFAP